jgi:hypothetical protein
MALRACTAASVLTIALAGCQQAPGARRMLHWAEAGPSAA